MPATRRVAAEPAGPGRAKRVRKPPVRPGDSPRATPPEPVPLDVFTRRLGVMEEDQAGIVVQLEQMDGSLENVTQRVGDLVLRMDGMGAVLEDIRARLGSLPAPVVPAAPLAPVVVQPAPVAVPGTTPIPPPPVDVLSRWPWVDISIVQIIAGGTFDIHDLPKLHSDETLRTRYVSRSVEGVLQPLSGGVPQLVHGKTKLQVSFSDFTTFMLAWSVYTSIRTTYAPERGPGLAFWLSQIALHTHLGYDFVDVLNYIVAYFQKYQKSSPEAWFDIDPQLHVIHFGNASRKAVSAARTQPTKAVGKPPPPPQNEQICHAFNRSTGCTVKERTGATCLRKHICGRCYSPSHSQPKCTNVRSV